MNHRFVPYLLQPRQQPPNMPCADPQLPGSFALLDQLLFGLLQRSDDLSQLASSVVVLPASPKLGIVKRTFLLCSKRTLSLCCQRECRRLSPPLRMSYLCHIRMSY